MAMNADQLGGAVESNSFTFTKGTTRNLRLEWVATQDEYNLVSTINWTLKGGGTETKEWVYAKDCSVKFYYYNNEGNIIYFVDSVTKKDTKIETYYGTTLLSGSFKIYHWSNGMGQSMIIDIAGYIYSYGTKKTGSETHQIRPMDLYCNINLIDPESGEEHYNYQTGEFDVYKNDILISAGATNEPSSISYVPIGTKIGVKNIKPVSNKPYLQFDKAIKKHFLWDSLTGGHYEKIDAIFNDDDGYPYMIMQESRDTMEIHMKNKESILTLDLNGGYIVENNNEQENKNFGPIILNPTLVYQGNNWNIINGYTPQRMGYKFVGWRMSNGAITHNLEGVWQEGNMWDDKGNCKLYDDVTIYAQWEVQNVAYVKTENGWELATIYIKTENEWKPAIMHVKTENGWKQSITR